jgi:CHAD domain-containing protein
LEPAAAACYKPAQMAKQSDIRSLSVDDTLQAAAGKILWTLFEDMWAFRESVLADFDAEGVHDMRVASRRLRTAMQTFRPCFPPKSFGGHYRHIRSIADLLGEVRDRDVQIEELETDVDRLPLAERHAMEDLVASIKTARDSRRDDLRTLLKRLDREAYDRDFLAYIARSVKWQRRAK